MPDQLYVLLGVVCTCIAAVQHAKIKYGGTSKLDKAVAQIDDLAAQMGTLDKDDLRNRVARLENHNGLDIFR